MKFTYRDLRSNSLMCGRELAAGFSDLRGTDVEIMGTCLNTEGKEEQLSSEKSTQCGKYGVSYTSYYSLIQFSGNIFTCKKYG